ncbi:hypothetical protein BASA83_008082, partial [Batrachochytrium salamandrivorans]
MNSVPSDILSHFSSLFSEDQAETLPPHRDFDCSIDLKPASEPFHGKIYQLTREEDKVMQEWIQDNLERVYSEQQFPSWRTMLLCKPKKDKLRLCMDYRGLNKNTVKDRNPIPLSLNFFEPCPLARSLPPWTCEVHTTFFASRKETSPRFFITKYGQFEFFGHAVWTCKCSSAIPAHDELLFRDVIGKHVLVYLDEHCDLLDSMSDHIAQVQNVLRVLQDNGLYCKAEKCHFYKSEIKYLAISLLMDFEWIHPKSRLFRVGRHQRKFGTCKFVRIYKLLSCPDPRLLQHDGKSHQVVQEGRPFVWGPEQEKVFAGSEDCLCNSDFLTHPDDSRPLFGDRCIGLCISGFVLSKYD